MQHIHAAVTYQNYTRDIINLRYTEVSVTESCKIQNIPGGEHSPYLLYHRAYITPNMAPKPPQLLLTSSEVLPKHK